MPRGAGSEYRLRIKNLPAHYAQKNRRTMMALSRLITEQTGIPTYNARTWDTWMSADEDFAYGFIEVTDEATGNDLIALIGGIVMDDRPLAAEWCHDSIFPVINLAHPNLRLTYHPAAGLLEVFDVTTNTTVPPSLWPQFHLPLTHLYRPP